MWLYRQLAIRPRKKEDSQRTVLCRSVVCVRADMSLVCGTVSKAFEKSIDTVTVLCGGLGWLKPRATLCARGRSAVFVSCCFRKPCCVGERGRELSSGSRSRSRTLTEGQRREMGRYPDPKSGVFPGFRIGTMMADFQIGGMLACW